MEHSNISRSENSLRVWVVAVVLGLVIGIIPLLDPEALSKSGDTFETWVHILWGAGIFLSAFVISVLQPKRVWRWGTAVGLGLPLAMYLRMSIESPERPSSYRFLFLIMFYGVFFAALPAFAGAVCGLLIRKTFDVVRKEGWR